MNLPQFLERDIRHTNYFYICGEIRRGVEMVVSRVYAHVKPRDMEYRVFHLSTDKQSEFVDSLLLASIEPRLIVVRDAERIDRWDIVFRWAVSPYTTTLVLVTNETNPRRSKHPEVFRWFAKYGAFVECNDFTELTGQQTIQKMLNVGRQYAAELFARTGGDSDRLLSFLELVGMAGVSSPKDIDECIVESPLDRLLEAMFDRRPHMPDIPPDSLMPAFGLLELDLVRQATVVGLMRKYVHVGEIIRRTEIPPFAIKGIIERSKHLTAKQLANRLYYLTRAQDLYRLGARLGLLEWFEFFWRIA